MAGVGLRWVQQRLTIDVMPAEAGDVAYQVKQSNAKLKGKYWRVNEV